MTMQELARLAAAEKMIPGAPIETARSVEIAAPVHSVWNTLTTVSSWERWYPYLKNAQLEGSFQPQSRLTYGGLIKHYLRIAKSVDQRLVMLYGTMMGYKGITRWELEAIAKNRTLVIFTESSAGFLLKALYSNEGLGDHLQQWLNRLKSEVERNS